MPATATGAAAMRKPSGVGRGRTTCCCVITRIPLLIAQQLVGASIPAVRAD